MNNLVEIRRYQTDAAEFLCQIYYHTIHTINTKDYTQEQMSAWAPWSSVEKYEGWLEKLVRIRPYDALINDSVVAIVKCSGIQIGCDETLDFL